METGIIDDTFETVGSTLFQEDQEKPTIPGGIETQLDDSQSSVVKTPEENKIPTESKPQQQVKDNTSSQTTTEPEGDKPEMVEYRENVLLRRLGSSFKEEGVDLEIPENVDVKTFVNTLSNTIINKEISDPDSPIIKSIIGKFAEENGLDETTMSIASGLSYGIDRKEYADLIELQSFSNLQVDLSDTEIVQDIFFTYHTLNGMDEKAAIQYTKIDIENADNDLLEARQQAIYDFATLGLNNIQQTVEERKALDKKNRDERVEKINTLYKKLNVAGQSFTKEEFDSYLKATSEKTEKIVYPNGVEANVTKFDKKRYEESVNNFEGALLQNMLFWLDKKDQKLEQKQDKNLADTRGKFMNGLDADLKQSKISNRSVDYNKANEDSDVMIVSSSF